MPENTAATDAQGIDLEQQQDLLRALLASSPDLLVMKDWQLVYRSVNPAFCRFLGREASSVLGRTDFELFPPALAEEFRRQDLEVLASGVSRTLERQVPGVQGVRWLQVVKTPVLTPEGTPSGVLSSMRDITAHKRSEEILASQRAQLLSIFDGIDEIIYVADPHTYEVLYVNKYFRTLLGSDPVGDLCHRAFQGRDRPCAFCTNDRILQSEGRPYKWEHYNPLLDRHMEVVDRIIEWPGRRQVRFELAIDITERKLDEQEERARLRRIRRQQQAIVDIATSPAVVSGDFRAAARAICRGVASALDVERASIWLLEADRTELRCKALFERSTGGYSDGTVLLAANYPTYFSAMRTGRVIDAHDARSDPRTREFQDGYLAPLGITSMLDAAVRVAGELVGVLCCEQVGPPREWQPDVVTFAGEAADQVAQALIHQARRHSEAVLKESEKRSQAILSSVQAGILVIDAESHRIIEANPAALQMIGASREQVLHRVCHGTICPEEVGHCPVTDLGERLQNVEHTLLNPATGSASSVLKTVVPIVLNGHDYLLESFIDITDRKRFEEQLERHVRELDKTKKYLEVLVADTTGRERRMVELKQEVNELLRRQGCPPRYRAPDQVETLTRRTQDDPEV